MNFSAVDGHVSHILEGLTFPRGSRITLRLNAKNEGWFTLEVNGRADRDFLPPRGHFAPTLISIMTRLREAGAHVQVDVHVSRAVEVRECPIGSVPDALMRPRGAAA